MSQSPRSPRRKVDTTNARIGFVGAGKIASSIIKGLVTHGNVDPKRIFVSAPSNNNTEALKLEHKGLKTTKRNIDIFGRFDCDIVFICVNPNVIRLLYKMGGTRPAALTTNYIPNMKHPVYVLSLVFGFTANQIKECLLNPENIDRYKVKFHRCVITSTVAHGFGDCYIDTEPDSPKMSELVRDTLSSIGRIEYIPENLLDATCVLVGSGLSFCYYFIQAISDGALKIGLPRNLSFKFAAKVASMAAQALLETGKSSTDLKGEVCSPSGGATYGLSVLDKADFASGIASAMDAALQRANDLAEQGNIE